MQSATTTLADRNAQLLASDEAALKLREDRKAATDRAQAATDKLETTNQLLASTRAALEKTRNEKVQLENQLDKVRAQSADKAAANLAAFYETSPEKTKGAWTVNQIDLRRPVQKTPNDK